MTGGATGARATAAQRGLCRRLVLGGGLALLVPAPGLARAKVQSQAAIAPGRGRHASSGQAFILEDGRHVRLGSVEAPRFAAASAPAQPRAAAARAALARLVEAKPVSFADPVPDKFGRLRAQVFAPGADAAARPLWVQGTLVAGGHVRVRTWRDDHARAALLLALEQRARAAGRGLWALPCYALRTPHSAAAAIGSFQIVEGRITGVAHVRGRGRRHGRIYLNFGTDWHRDFSISISAKNARAFAKEGVELMRLSGALVRARGQLRRLNGPILYLDHPQALEVLQRPTGKG